MWLNGLIILQTMLAIANYVEPELTIEAAFQGHCGHNSPCEQLCYEIHDGMYECDCTEGYELNKNGYSCQELNATYLIDNSMKSEEDILYQKGVSFSAKLDNNHDNNIDASGGLSSSSSSSSDDQDDSNYKSTADITDSIQDNNYDDDDDDVDDDDILTEHSDELQHQKQQQQQQQQLNNVPENLHIDIPTNKLSMTTTIAATSTTTTTKSTTKQQQQQQQIPSISAIDINNLEYYDIYYSNSNNNNNNKDMSVYDDVNNNKLNLRPIVNQPQTYQHENYNNYNDKGFKATTSSSSIEQINSSSSSTTQATIKLPTKIIINLPTIIPAKPENLNKIKNHFNQNENYFLKNIQASGSGSSSHRNTKNNEFARILDKNHDNSGGGRNFSWNSNDNNRNIFGSNSDTDDDAVAASWLDHTAKNTNKTTIAMKQREPCGLDCGSDGICEYIEDDNNNNNAKRCLCPFGKTGNFCAEDMKVNIPRFTHKSWLAFPALRGAYKHVQLRIEFRPESFDGIILLTGERDDLTGDFMALLIHQGFIEFWFDCGSGVGNVKSKETVELNQWNSVTIYRHRWDAWLVLNNGDRVQGRSKGLFSRITFREPVFLGGTGNITGLAKRLPVHSGMIGCIRRFVANEHEYKFIEHPLGDVTKGFDIQDCTTDKCVKYPCQHGGKCLPSDQGAVCLCPLGFGGDLCEMRLDLQVPSFNGSSYLRYTPLGDSALIWLELQIVIKPHQNDGILLFSGHEDYGDYIALSLNLGYVEFAFDLGSGSALVRSEYPLTLGQWHTIKISRTARLAVLKIDQHSEVMTISSNGFWHLSLPHSLYLGGVHNAEHLPIDLKQRGSFIGCIQKVEINGHSLSIISEALGGTNVDNCPHACVARPCGPLAQCIPIMDSYECRCDTFNNFQCNKAEEVSLKQIPQINQQTSQITNTTNLNNEQDIRATTATATIQTVDENNDNSDSSTEKSDLYYYDDSNTSNNNNDYKADVDNYDMNLMKNRNLNSLDNSILNGNINDKINRDEKKLLTIQGNYKRKNLITLTTPSSPIVTQSSTTTKSTTKTTTTTTNKIDKDDEIFDYAPIELNYYTDDDDDNNDEIYGQTASLKKAQVDVENDQFIITTTTTKLNRKKQQNGHHKLAKSLHKNHHSLNHHSHHHHKKHEVNHESQQQHNKENFVKKLNQTKHDQHDEHDEHHRKEHSTFLLDTENDYQAKILMQDMERIMKNENDFISRSSGGDGGSSSSSIDDEMPPNKQQHDDDNIAASNFISEKLNSNEVVGNNNDDVDDDSDDNNNNIDIDNEEDENVGGEDLDDTDYNGDKLKHLNSLFKIPMFHKSLGACFTGTDSYFHYNDAETMSQIISYKIDLNLRFKTNSKNGVILWSGRYSALDTDDFLSLGIENGYLHFRYNLGSGETNIRFNASKVSDGLWHRVRATRNSQEGYLEVDGRKSVAQRSPGKLRQLNTDAGLFVGGMNKAAFYTRRRYSNGIIGCISEIVLGGELRLNLDPSALGNAHNIEAGIL